MVGGRCGGVPVLALLELLARGVASRQKRARLLSVSVENREEEEERVEGGGEEEATVCTQQGRRRQALVSSEEVKDILLPVPSMTLSSTNHEQHRPFTHFSSHSDPS